jgi:hypothetical protein
VDDLLSKDGSIQVNLANEVFFLNMTKFELAHLIIRNTLTIM